MRLAPIMLVGALLAPLSARSQDTEKAPPSRESVAVAAHQAIEDGFRFLREKQNKDGSWGSHDPVALEDSQLGFGLTSRGAQHSVRLACTSIIAKAFLHYPLRTKEHGETLDKGIHAVLSGWKCPYDPGEAFNVWGYAYILDFLTALWDHPYGSAHRNEMKRIIPEVIEQLRKLQAHEGGWAYYSDPGMGGDCLSFTTASVMLPLMKAKKQGFDIPEGMLGDAAKIMKRMMYPDKNMMYGYYLKRSTTHPLEELGAGARTQAGGLALHHYDDTYTREILRERNQFFFKTLDYVERIGNKRIIPHRDAPHNISGYFFYYGCYYAAEVMTLLGKDVPPEHWNHLVTVILRNQEKEKSWWDTICYGYGDKWGTGFAILSLEHYLAAHGALEKKPAASRPAGSKP
ncbi:MAG: hypothetical protein HY716_12045 [Planctomycetes bacterium]|nr:hypothetical protein [Planctomycetota bacterium]